MDEVEYRQNLAKSIEKTSMESHRMLDEARQEKMRYLEEFHSAQKKVSDLQNHLKDLEGHVVEKDALIRALQIPKGMLVKCPLCTQDSYDAALYSSSRLQFQF